MFCFVFYMAVAALSAKNALFFFLQDEEGIGVEGLSGGLGEL